MSTTTTPTPDWRVTSRAGSSSTVVVPGASAARLLFRRTGAHGGESDSPLSSSAAQLDQGEEKQNGDDNLQLLQPLEPSFHAQFDAFAKRLAVSTTVRELAQLRNDVLDWARSVKREQKWHVPTHGPRLNLLLAQIQDADQTLQAENMEIIEAPEMTKILSDDPHQHQCDLYIFFRVLVGWCFVFALCQVPWLVVVIVFKTENEQDDFVISLDGSTASSSPVVIMDPELQAPCQSLTGYLIGFYVLLISNIVFSLVVASAQSVDNSRNLVVRRSRHIMGFLGFCLIAYNVYGVILIWNAQLWNSDGALSPRCLQARNLTVATLSFFFILPILCILVGMLGREGKKHTSAEQPPPQQLQRSATDERGGGNEQPHALSDDAQHRLNSMPSSSSSSGKALKNYSSTSSKSSSKPPPGNDVEAQV